MNEMSLQVPSIYTHMGGNIPDDMLGICHGINDRKEYAVDMLLDMLWHILWIC